MDRIRLPCGKNQFDKTPRLLADHGDRKLGQLLMRATLHLVKKVLF